jgi:hypothetical protein
MSGLLNEINNLIDEVNGNMSEGGFSKLIQIMHGDAPKVWRFAIMTAENPQGNKQSTQLNRVANKSLESKIRGMNYGYTPIKGKYGNLEHSFFISNIQYKQALALATEFNQESFIFGRKIYDSKGNLGVEFQYVEPFSGGNHIKSLRQVVLTNVKDIHNLTGTNDDFYSSLKGRKFYIPFFDDSHKDAKFNGGRITFETSKLPQDPKILSWIADIKECESKLELKGKVESFYWTKRGIIKERLSDIRKYLGINDLNEEENDGFSNKLQGDIDQARAEIKNGQYLTLDQFKKELNL